MEAKRALGAGVPAGLAVDTARREAGLVDGGHMAEGRPSPVGEHRLGADVGAAAAKGARARREAQDRQSVAARRKDRLRAGGDAVAAGEIGSAAGRERVWRDG